MRNAKAWLQDVLRRPKGGAGSTTARSGAISTDVLKVRRKLVQSSVVAFLGVQFLSFLRFFFPRVLYEPKTTFAVGYPSDFRFGVDTRFKNAHRVWIVRNGEGVVAIFARCTHLGCTPNWMAGEHKFKCPCHGSGFDEEGINFEGPAPRPLDRASIILTPTGEIEVDTSRFHRFGTWDRPGAIVRI